MHHDVIKRKHFPCYWPFVWGIHRLPVNSPTKASAAELWCYLKSVWTISWANNVDAGDLRRHRAHHDVIVMGRKNCLSYRAVLENCERVYKVWGRGEACTRKLNYCLLWVSPSEHPVQCGFTRHQHTLVTPGCNQDISLFIFAHQRVRIRCCVTDVGWLAVYVIRILFQDRLSLFYSL